MDESYTFPAGSARAEASPVRSVPARAVLLAAGAAFLLGSGLTYYLAREVDWSFGTTELAVSTPANLAGETAEPRASPTASPAAPQGAAEARRTALAVEEVFEQQGGIDQRVAAMEQRLARLDLQAQAAAGNASRAEGLLIAFAARRAIERGEPLGYLEDQLVLRFGDALPNAVEAVIAAGADPVTIDQLLVRLERMAPELSQEPEGAGLLASVGREISQLFVFRTEDTPSPQPQSRLQRARLFLESGQIQQAIGAVRNMPSAGRAEAWIADAERLDRAQRGLELLETTAILEPRRLRDGTGNTVEQPSPAA